MEKNIIKVLIIEDNPLDLRYFKEILSDNNDFSFDIFNESSLKNGSKSIKRINPDIIFLDLGLPDSQGAETVQRLKIKTKHIPIIVLTGANDSELGLKAIRKGAQDYIEKTKIDSRLLSNAIQYSIERKKIENELQFLSFHDELTGLYNRYFFEVELKRVDAERQIPLSIIFIDIDKLKETNDNLGHIKGDEVICKCSEILKQTSRQEDVVSRWGGDEFVILLPKTSFKDAERVANRIKKDSAKKNLRLSTRGFQ